METQLRAASVDRPNTDAEKEIYVRYVQNLYDVLERLRKKHPKLEIEIVLRWRRTRGPRDLANILTRFGQRPTPTRLIRLSIPERLHPCLFAAQTRRPG